MDLGGMLTQYAIELNAKGGVSNLPEGATVKTIEMEPSISSRNKDKENNTFFETVLRLESSYTSKVSQGSLLRKGYLCKASLRITIPNYSKAKIEDLFHSNSWFELDIGGQRCERYYLFTIPLLHAALFNTRLNMIKHNGTDLQIELPFYFDPIIGGNVVPFMRWHDIVLRARLMLKPVLSSHQIDTKFLCDISACELPNNVFKIENGDPTGEKLIFQTQFTGDETLFTTDNASMFKMTCRLNYDHPVTTLMLALYDENDTLIRHNILESINLQMYQPYTDINFRPVDIFGKCTQLLPLTFQHMKPTQNIECRPVLFPIEIWARIFQHVERPWNLMIACKYLWKCAHVYSIQKDLFPKLSRNPVNGWYFMSFNNNKLMDYKVLECPNFSRIDNATLRMKSLPEYSNKAFVLKIVAFSFNGYRTMAGMGGLAWSM